MPPLAVNARTMKAHAPLSNFQHILSVYRIVIKLVDIICWSATCVFTFSEQMEVNGHQDKYNGWKLGQMWWIIGDRFCYFLSPSCSQAKLNKSTECCRQTSMQADFFPLQTKKKQHLVSNHLRGVGEVCGVVLKGHGRHWPLGWFVLASRQFPDWAFDHDNQQGQIQRQRIGPGRLWPDHSQRCLLPSKPHPAASSGSLIAFCWASPLMHPSFRRA